VKDGFFKFPSTPHLATLECVEVRDDKVLSEDELYRFLQNELVVEEKVDGTNLGISFNTEGSVQLQNRGSYLQLPGVGQWKKLEQWLNPKMDILFNILSDRYILFGEWCYAQHSVFYNHLPDWFFGFDLYDKREEKFLSVEQRDKLFDKMGINKVPQLGNGHYSFSEIQQLLDQSKISDEPAEGLYIRVDKGSWLLKRAKLVRSSFIQSVEEHWSRSAIIPNQLDSKIWEMHSD
jgi:ATP-dependent RNA circularization protein (DNA/RNA ligase family)